MKNKFVLKQLFEVIVILILSCNYLLADDVLIDAEVVDIQEKGNLIIATGSVNIVDDGIVKITGNEAKYNKLNQTIEILGDVVLSDKIKNYKAKSDKLIFDRKKNTITSLGSTEIEFFDENENNLKIKLKGTNSFFDKKNEFIQIKENVIVKDFVNEIEIFSEYIDYNRKEEIIKSLDETQINYKNEIKIFTKSIEFNKKNSLFSSQFDTLVNDSFGNKFNLSTFSFDINEKILKAEKITLSDKNENSVFVKNGYVNLKSGELVGSDFNLNLSKNFFGNPENDPRLIGRYIITNKSETTMKKSTFTTCKKVDGKCPAWSISANEVSHKKDKKRIEYKKAWVEIYDVPVAYFPYFFHPDPTVERQSGFLFPQFVNSSNLGFSTQIPYFKVIDVDKDMTISPRIYSNNNLFIQSEYRQVFKNSDLIADVSYNNKDDSNTHFFSTLKRNIENSLFEIKLETVSNKDYLKKYQIQSPLISSYSVLNSTILYEKFEEDYTFSTSLNVIEDLSKSNNDKYEYTIPQYDFSKENNLNNNFFNNYTINSSGSYRKFDTNVDEADIINDLVLNANNQNKFTNLGTDFKVLIRNINTYGNKSKSYKENGDHRILNTALLNLKYPMIKEKGNNKNFLTPLASFRYSPYKGTNLRDKKDILIKFDDLFLLDRINNKTVEDGASATLGLEYKNLKNNNSENLKLGLALNFRNKEDEDIPLSSSLGQKTSDLIGYSGINITENLSFDYNFSIDQNLSETNYSLLSANYDNSKFKTSFQYMEKSNHIGDESYLKNSTELQINKTNSLSFETNKNIDKNLTDYYNLIYKYKNDCLEASLVYNKQFYQDDTINSGKNIFFKISFIPFGTVNTPNINE